MPPGDAVPATRIRGPATPHARRAADRHRDSAEGLRVLLSLAGRARVGRVIVFIPAHNEAASIKETISSLRRQSRPPDEIIVVSDNSSDATDDRSMLHGAKVMVTVGNSARKAGALNQALGQVLPGLGRQDLALVMDADSQLAPDWIRCAVDAMDRDPELGGVSGTYTGEDGPGLLRQLQRNEFVRASRLVRRRYDLWVLSGTGTMFQVSALREVARERGRSLPGVPGEYYDSSSITEDYEITLALKTLGYRCLCPPGCTAITELMPTWRHLFQQRLRWQSGTLTALRRYGFTRATWANWVRQAFFYGRYCSQIACWVILIYSLVAHFGFSMPGWVLGMLLTIYLERVITARGAGRRGVLIAALLLPEWWYGMFDGLYLFQALRREFTHHDVSWNHVVKDSAGNAAPNHRRVPPARRAVLVREAGHG
jgi:poly-beta-1,6-N-acetyl-D-glucosamine synthase